MHWFEKCNIWKKSLRTFRGSWGQEVILEVGEAKFWNSSNFHRFSLEDLSFEVVWHRRPRRPQKGPREFFQKLQFRNQWVPTKKMRFVTAFWSMFSLNLSLWNILFYNRLSNLAERAFFSSITVSGVVSWLNHPATTQSRAAYTMYSAMYQALAKPPLCNSNYHTGRFCIIFSKYYNCFWLWNQLRH